VRHIAAAVRPSIDAGGTGRKKGPAQLDLRPGPLIRHIVFFTAKNPATIDTMIDELGALGTIPGVLHFEATRNSKVDQISNEVDVVVYAEFPDEAALKAYKAHPTYAETTRRVRPMRELRLSADFTARK
jgi:hypothetical protein